jgi:hypothetical protein
MRYSEKTKSIGVQFFLVLLCTLVLVFASCQTKSQTGALVGGAAGAGTGALIGHAAGSTAAGAAIGGAVGAGGGYLLGRHMENKNGGEYIAGEPNEFNTTTVNVLNSNGTTTPVTLRKQGDIWIGPRGETYNTLPTPDQLKSTYGF